LGSIRPQILNGDNLLYWKTTTRAYVQSLGAEVWAIVERGYQYLATVSMDPEERKSYEFSAKVANALLGSLSESKFVKVMQFNTTKEIWDRNI